MANEFLRFLVAEAEERAQKYRIYRDYYEGEHDVQLTDRQRSYLQVGSNQHFSANYIPIVVDSLANRLSVVSFSGDNEDLVNKWWIDADMDASQNAVHSASIRDGDSYVLVDWNSDEGRPVFRPHLAYDGRDGCTVHYDGSQLAPVAATKRWSVEFGDGAGKVRRLNIYWPHKIERFYSNEANAEWGWMPYTDDGQPAVIDWTDDGVPIGIPIIHFTNRSRGMRYGLSEMESGIPMQNAINKSVVDLLAAADASGFRIMTMIGDDAADVKVSPGMFINSLKPAGEVEIQAIPGEPMRPLIETVDSFVQRVGQVTDTPLSYFQQSGQMASEGTQDSHEGRMLVKARVTSTEIGNAWERVMYQAIRMHNAFAGGNLKTGKLNTVWADFDVRDEVERLKARAEVVKLLVESGASIENAALIAGFDEAEAKKLAEIDETNDPMRLIMAKQNAFSSEAER